MDTHYHTSPVLLSFVSSYFQDFPSKLVSSLSLSALLEWPVEPVLL